MLGDSTWSNFALPHAPGAEYLKRLWIAESFFPLDEGATIKQFVREYEKMFLLSGRFRYPPHYTAYAYDTLRILMTLLLEPRNHSHSDLQKALLGLKGFLGATGDLSFSANGEIMRKMRMINMKGRRFIASP